MADTAKPDQSHRLGPLEIYLDGYRAYLSGEPLELSPSQFEVLCLLVSNHQRVISREEIREVVGLQYERSVDVILSALRKKIGSNFIRNIRRRGWIVHPESLET